MFNFWGAYHLRVLTEVFTRTYESVYLVLTEVFTRTYESVYEVPPKSWTLN